MKKEDVVLFNLYDEPEITVKRISERLKITERQVKRIISKFKKDGYVVRVGSDKHGYWKVIKGVNDAKY